jgi:hypothetical protein
VRCRRANDQKVRDGLRLQLLEDGETSSGVLPHNGAGIGGISGSGGGGASPERCYLASRKTINEDDDDDEDMETGADDSMIADGRGDPASPKGANGVGGEPRTSTGGNNIAIVRPSTGKTTADDLGGCDGGGSSGCGGGGGGGGGDGGAAITVFASAQLSRFTSKYSVLLGAGAFGNVYGGTLPGGRLIAVKQMELQKKKKKKKKLGGRADPYSGEAGFRLELGVLSKYRHPNLVELIGYCEEKQLLKATRCYLVLEHMTGGALLARLQPWHAGPPLTAQQRFDIAAGVARGLHYLHAEARPPLIHQDVKTDNVLLATGVGGKLVAKVADFGTARIAPQLALSTSARGATHLSTGIIVGTRPYMAPEYAQLGQVSEKTDTFAYGVVLLELLTGMPPIDESTSEVLHQSAYDMLCDPAARLAPLLDARVPAAAWATRAGCAAGAVSGRALELCLVAKQCLELQVRLRNTMRKAMPAVVAVADARMGLADSSTLLS